MFPVKNIFRIILFLFALHSSLFIEAQEAVTSIYGDYGGFFTSTSGSINTYNDSNNLLGFTVDGVTYSTGVNDATLTSNDIIYTSGVYYAFPMPASITVVNNSLIGIGANWGGITQNNSSTDFIKTFSPIVPSYFVRDGNSGLELATNFFNIRPQVITYDAIVINQVVSINDAQPDIIVTQTGSPGATDEFKFIDSSGTTVGVELDVIFGGVSKVGITRWTIYRVNPVTGVVNSLFGANTPRDLRVLSIKLSDFGITTSNFNQITNFVHTTSGNTDIAFTAFNSDALEINLPATELEVSSSNITADDFCSPTTATFETTITNNSTEASKDFEVDFIIPAGMTLSSSSSLFSSTASSASFSGLENKWIIAGLDAAQSVTLTVSYSVGSTSFPISFTATSSLVFQPDSVPSNNTETISNTGLDNDCDGVNDSSDLDDDNDGILDSTEGTGDFDGDGIPNNLDLDSDGDQCPDALEGTGSVSETDLDVDFVITGTQNGSGVPDLAAAGGGAGQGIGNSQNISIKTCVIIDTDIDGVIDLVDLDDDNDGILDTVENALSGDPIVDKDNNGILDYKDPGLVGFVDTNSDSIDDRYDIDLDGVIDQLDTDSDGDGCPDAIEGGAGFTFSDIDLNNKLIGGVDNNGIPLVATTSGQLIGGSQDAGVLGASCSLLPVIISQIYQTVTGGNAIELTNIGATTVTNVRIVLFKDMSPSSGDTPTASLLITASIPAGASIVVKSVATLTDVTLINSPTEELNTFVTDLAGGNDTVILSTTDDTDSWDNRYDVVSDISDETSLVRIDEVTQANTIFTSSEWISFIDDAIEVLGDTDPIPVIVRHANDPLLSEVKIPIADTNQGLGLHRINPTIRTTSSWSNGFPDKSRSVIIQETYEHSASSLNARILDVQDSNVLSINNDALIVLNNTNINDDAEIRVLGTAQFIQVHDGDSEITGNGKLLISQKSEVPNVYRYNYWSSPVLEFVGGNTYRVSGIMKDSRGNLSSSSIITDIDFVSGYDGAPAVGLNPIQISNYWIWAYFNNITRDDWVQLKETSYLGKGLGFIMKSTGVNPQYFTFSGSPIDGDISFNISGNTTSLLGNPYAGTLDGNAFILNNENTIDGTLYFWEHTGESTDQGHSKYGYEGGYAQLNLAMGTAANSIVTGISGLTDSYTYAIPTRYIAAGQGFFVTSDSDGGTINFNNKQRSYQAIKPNFFKGGNTNIESNLLPILKLGMDFTNKNYLKIHRQIGISFKENNSYAFDYGYEGEMIDVQPTDLFWNFHEMDNKKLVIAGIESINDNLKIPLTVVIDSEEPIFIKIDELENIDKNIYLFDALEETTKQLKSNELVDLDLAKGTYENRFFITFNKSKVLATNNEVLEVDLKIYLDDNLNKVSIINNTNLFIEKVEMFNVLGQKIKHWNLNLLDKRIALDIGNLSTSIYIVKVKTNKGSFTSKILKK